MTSRNFTEAEKRRLANVRTLANRFESNKELGAALGLTKSGISQLIGANPTRPISERTARRWEKRLQIPEGTLDLEPQQPSPAPGTIVPPLSRAIPSPQPNGAEVILLDTVMRDVDASLARTQVQLSADKYRGTVTLLYRWSMRYGQVESVDVDNLIRLVA